MMPLSPDFNTLNHRKKTMIEMKSTDSKVVILKATGKLQYDHFKRITPRVDSLIKKHKTISFLIDLTDFEGWEDKKTAEEHFTFVKEHHHKVDRVALISDHIWQQWLGGFANVFMHPKIKTFEPDERKQAEKWLLEK